MKQFDGTSLKIRLYLMVLAAFLPVVVLVLFVAEEQKHIETHAILDKTVLLARAAADAENQQMESVRILLGIVADALAAADGQAARLTGLLTRLPERSDGFVAVGVLDASGNLMAGSDRSQMTPSYADRSWFAASLNAQGMVMDRYQGARIDGRPVLYFARGVAGDRQPVTAVVFAALDLDWMNRVIFGQLAELPQGARLTLMDADGGMLRFDVDTGQWSVPPPLAADLAQQIADAPTGALVAADANGDRRIVAFARMDSALRRHHIRVVLEIPEAVAMATSMRAFVRNLALLAASAAMAILSIWWIADVFILRRVGAMVRVSRRLADGDLRARIGRIGARDELSHLAGVFDDMAASLQMRIEREEQVKASLERSREQLRRLSAYQNDVREQERIRIAREIHDQLGQSLTILKMDLAWFRRHLAEAEDAMQEKINAMVQVIEAAMDSLHAVTAELRPVILDDFGLAAAIEWQAEAFSRRSGIRCRLEIDGDAPDPPVAQATALFRIFQETLTNILRHAQASEVTVRLSRSGDTLFFQVADNGRGITAAEIDAPDAFGLLGIRERLHPFGGRVSFDGRKGLGTRVTIHLPIPQAGDNP